MKSFNKIALTVSAALLGSMAVVAPAHANVPTVAVTVNAAADNDANTIAGAHTALCLWFPVATCRAPFAIRYPRTTL